MTIQTDTTAMTEPGAQGVKPVLVGRGLVKSYTNAAGQSLTALNGVSVDLYPGKWLSIIGPSGSGKSTLLSLLGLLEPPDEGTVTVLGENTASLSDRKQADLRAQTIGFVFQQFNLIQTMTVLENVLLPMAYACGGVPGRALEKSARLAIDQVGLSDRIAHRPRELSGGEVQRVAIARAIASNQPVILADEPTGNLDSATGDTILDLLRSRRDAGSAVLVVTHEQKIAEIGDNVLALKDGKVDKEHSR